MKATEGFGFTLDADGAFARTARVEHMSLKQARQSSCDARVALQGLLTTITGAKRPLTTPEASAVAGLKDFSADVARQLQKREDENEAERRGEAVDDPDAMASADAARRAGFRVDAGFMGGAATIAQPSGRTFAAMFPRAGASWDGWRDSSEFLGTIHAGLADSRLHSIALDGGLGLKATAGEFSDPSGGFSVPSQLAAAWMDSSLGDELVRSRCRVWPMASSALKIPAWDESGSETLGGWTAEAAEITPSTPAMRLLTLTANKCAVLVEVSLELLQDGQNYAQQLDAKMIKHIGRHFDRGFLLGAGAGEPQGLLHAGNAALIVVDKETGQAADTITYTNIVTMYSRLLPASMRKAVWLASSTTIPSLLQLTIPIGTSGAFVPAMSERDGKFSMLGLEVLFSDLLPALGDQGDIVLADLSAYNVGMRSDIALEKSAHVGFSRATVYFRALIRADGRPGLKAPITPDTGDTLSAFVTLAAR